MLKHKTILAGCFGALSLLVSLPLQAEDLMQVYQQALSSDPTFKEAEADWLSTKEDLAIAEAGTGTAGSGLFPFVEVSGALNRTHEKITLENTKASGYYNGNEYFLTVTQPIFNYQTWKSISSARYTVKAATATYLAAAQDLMYRVADAYFNVLSANDTLRYTLAQKRQFLHQLITAQQKFKVGLIAITGVYDAKASYDSSISDAISDRNALQDQLENLRAITGQYYKSLKGLNKTIPLIVPKPKNIEDWVKIALQQNYTIKADQNTMLADRELIKEARAGRYPEITGVAAYGAETTGNVSTLTPSTPDTTTTSGYVALDLDMPIFQGGYVSAETRQAEYNYLSASDALEYEHRDVVNQTRQSFLGVESGISKIRADQQAINSARNQLEATEAGYTVGTRTMVDVLDSVTSLYEAQETWSSDRYGYVMYIVTLKQEAGTLSPNDLKMLNRWLTKEETFNLAPIKVNTKYNKMKLPSVKSIGSSVQKPKPISHKPVAEAVKTKNTLAAVSNSRYYAVQLYADHAQSTADAFIHKQSAVASDALHVVDSKYGGASWYRVLYGHYGTRAEAEKALEAMPSELKQYRPWVVLMLEPYHAPARSTQQFAKTKEKAVQTVATPAVPSQSTPLAKSTPVNMTRSSLTVTKAAPAQIQQDVPSLNAPSVDRQVSTVTLPTPNDSAAG